MAVTALNSTTLSEAVDVGTFEFAVASTTNITVGNVLVIGKEALSVREIPVSGRVQCSRGITGTYAYAHPNAAVVWIGTPDAFKVIKDSATAITGNPGSLPDYLLPGQKAVDGAGNEYMLVDLTTTCFSGTTVQISMDGLFTAAPVVGGGQGPVGLLVEEGTSSQWAWAQIYGFNTYAQDSTITSAGTSASLAAAATSVSTPNVGLAVLAASSVGAFYIYGMFITGIATSTTTSATSATGVAFPVFLNYPYTTSVRGDISSL